MQAHKQAPSLYLRAPTIYNYAATDRPDPRGEKCVPRNAAFFVISVTKVVLVHTYGHGYGGGRSSEWPWLERTRRHRTGRPVMAMVGTWRYGMLGVNDSGMDNSIYLQST